MAKIKIRKEIIILGVILLVGAFLRLYKINEYMTFLGDEGRDVLIVRRFLAHGDIFLIGPGSSVGNMYLGPLYYYLMAPALWLGGFSPVAPAVMIALMGVATIALVWFVGREWFGKSAGLIAAFLYAIAPTVIIFSRASWNPNIMPFFSLLCIFALWRVLSTKKLYWLPILGISFAFVLQSHYLGLLLVPTLGILWLYGVYLFKKANNLKKYLAFSLLAFICFALLMSPLLIFDYRHNWQNFEAMKKFFLERQTTVSIKPWNALPGIWPLMQETSTRLIAGRNELFGAWAALMVVGGLVLGLINRKLLTRRNKFAFLVLALWLLFSLIGLGLYKQHIYDHYYGVFFPVPFLILGGAAWLLYKKAKIRGLWIALTALLFFTYFNILDNPLRYAPNNQLANTRRVAEKIEEEAKGERFNLAVIAERNYEDAYQYFLEWWEAPVVDIDPLNADATITEQLFVVCELPEEKCDPTHNPKTEVANFGWSKIENQWEVSGVILYKLVHSQ